MSRATSRSWAVLVATCDGTHFKGRVAFPPFMNAVTAAGTDLLGRGRRAALVDDGHVADVELLVDVDDGIRGFHHRRSCDLVHVTSDHTNKSSCARNTHKPCGVVRNILH